jgi:diguanylate cyclase (GGDEF)-like protein
VPALRLPSRSFSRWLRSRPSPARALRQIIAAGLLALSSTLSGLPCAHAGGLVGSMPTASFPQPVQAARVAAARSPQQALQMLEALRERAVQAADLGLRLAADEASCRVLGDIDTTKAIAVADAGLAVVQRTPPVGALRESWLRLRACRAGMWNERGERQRSLSELDRLLAETDAQAVTPARSIILLERGVVRSRAGELDAGQQDLIAACSSLGEQADPHDRRLCLGHLANHYRRIGDAEEALHLLQPLCDEARRDGHTYDLAIYTFAMAQVLQMQSRWADSLAVFAQAAAANEALADHSGLAYAEHGIARSLQKLGRAAEALQHVDRALSGFDREADPRQHEVMTVTRAALLAALDRAEEALPLLEAVAPAIRARGNMLLQQDWCEARAASLAGLGRWREAYQAAAQARSLQEQLSAQQLSEQSARWRMQFNRARDAQELSALRQLNEQGQQLRRTQAVALGLFVVLLIAVMVLAWIKVRQARRLQTLASTDELTGVANRRALMAGAERELALARAQNRPLALLMIDVDHFKRINDTHGHPVGDAVLRHLARVLGVSLRERDRLGRIGGEEFVVVLPGSSLEAARSVAERTRAAVAAAPLDSGGLCVRFSISVGVAEVAAVDGLKELFAKADAALYRAKASGRNVVVAHEPASDQVIVAPGQAQPG